MNTADLLWERWRQLGAASKASGESIEINTIALDVITGYGPIRLMLHGESLPAMLIPVDPADALPDDMNARGIEFLKSVYRVGDKNVFFIEIRCSDKRLAEVFSKVMAEVVRRITEGRAWRAALQESLDAFRNLLGRLHDERITRERVVGLAGEMCFLLTLLERSDNAVSNWVGSEAAQHDFRGNDAAVEVKSILEHQQQIVTIHGVSQLEVPPGMDLALAVYRFHLNPDGEISVPDLVGRIRDLTSEPELFASRLGSAGYVEASRKSWEYPRMTLAGNEIYSVRDDFPRITRGSFRTGLLPDGVTSLSYQINLGTASSYRLGAEDIEVLTNRVVGK